MATASTPKSIKASVYIDGKPAESSLKNIRQATNQLRRELDTLTVGTEAWNKKMLELRAHERTLRDIRNEIQGVGGAFGWLKTEIGKLGALAVGFLGFQFITDKFQGIINGNAKLSDSIAAVRRTANLSEAAARSLYTELGKIDTRTSRSELLKIAEIGGQFNVPTEQLKGFVTQIDRANVVLGSEFKGGAEEITTQLALLRNVFSDIKSDRVDQDLGYIGNALIVLAQEGAATAPIVAELANRLAPLEATAKLSSGAVLGLSATLQELGVKPEAGASAVLRLFDKMISNANQFAKVAGMSGDAFKKLLEDDAMGAFNKVLLGFKKGGENVAVLNETVEELEVNGVNAKGVLVKLSENTAMLSQKVLTAGEALTSTQAITDQYNISNENFAGTLDKLGKKFSQLSTNTTLVELFTNLVVAASKSIDFFQEHIKAIAFFAKTLIVAGIAWGVYRAATALATAEQIKFLSTLRTALALETLEIVATTALAAAKALLTGNLTKARQEWKLLNVAMGTNPWGLAAAAIAAVVTALILFRNNATYAAKAQGVLNDINSTAKKNMTDELATISALNKVRADENVSHEKRISAVKRMNELFPDILKGLTAEEALTRKGTVAINAYIAALERKSKAEAAQEKIKDLQKENIDLANNTSIDGTSTWDNIKAAGINMATGDRSRGAAYLAGKVRSSNQSKIAENNSVIKEIQNTYKDDIVANILGDGGDTSVPAGKTLDMLEKKLAKLKEERKFVTLGSKEYLSLTKQIRDTEAELDKYSDSKNKASGNKAESAREKALKEFEKLDDDYKKLNLQRLDDQLSANQKEVAQVENKYRALIEKEKEFLNRKGATKEQKSTTKMNIFVLETQQETAVKELRDRQTSEMLASVADLHTKLADLHESELIKQQDQINKFFDAEEKKNIGNQENLDALKLARTRELTDAEIREKERLEKEKAAIESEYDTLGGNKKENKLGKINKKYDDELAALKLSFSAKIQATKEYQDAVDAIEKNRAAEIKQQDKIDLQDKRNFQIEIAQKASDSVFSIIKNNQAAQLESALSSIERQRTAELDAKGLTEAQKQKINDKYDAKVREQKIKGFKADQAAAVAQAVVNGALAVTKVLAQTGILSPFAIPAIVAGTAFEIGTILAQPVPEFAGGGFSDEDPQGYVGQATVFKNSASGRPFVAGEAGKEWIAPNWMLKNPRYANLINTLEVARKEKRAFASGGFNGSEQSGQAQRPGESDLFTELFGRIDQMAKVVEQVANKKTYIVYSELEAYAQDIMEIRNAQGT